MSMTCLAHLVATRLSGAVSPGIVAQHKWDVIQNERFQLPPAGVRLPGPASRLY